MIVESRLRFLVEDCRGNVSEVARRLGLSRLSAGRKVSRAGLDAEAARLRAENGVSGTRSHLVLGSVDPLGEREAIAEALRLAGWNQSEAARSLGMGRTRLQRAMERLGINVSKSKRLRGK